MKELSENCTATTGNDKPVSLDKMVAALREIGTIPKRTTWLLVSPDGMVYEGTPEQLTPVILNAHPRPKLQFGI